MVSNTLQQAASKPSSHSLAFQFSEKDISIASIARYFGGRSGYKPDEKTQQRIRRCLRSASELVTPRAVYSLQQVNTILPGNKISLTGGSEIPLPDCFDDSGCTLIAAVIGTLGPDLEGHSHFLATNGNIYESTLFDAIGTAMLDLLSDWACKRIESHARRQKLHRGNRFSPGLDGYPMAHQELLFHLVDSQLVGVQLNSSNIMAPAKSVSFFLMLSKKTGKRVTENKCSSCRLQNCQFRTAAAGSRQ